jgi:hypothetical protein
MALTRLKKSRLFKKVLKISQVKNFKQMVTNADSGEIPHFLSNYPSFGVVSGLRG